MQLPPGIAAMIAAVTPCAATAAIEALRGLTRTATCGPESLIGHDDRDGRLGGKPFVAAGQRLPDEGALRRRAVRPLACTDANAGPFQPRQGQRALDDQRQRRNRRGHDEERHGTSQDTRRRARAAEKVNVTVERPGDAHFEFNPTSCKHVAVTGHAGRLGRRRVRRCPTRSTSPTARASRSTRSYTSLHGQGTAKAKAAPAFA